MDGAVLLELVDALSRAHTETTCARAVFEVLSSRLAIRSFVLEVGETGEAGETRAAGAGLRTHRVPPSSAVPRGARVFSSASHEAIDGAVVRVTLQPARSASLPEGVADTVGRVVAAWLRQARTLARVAELSRAAIARSRELDGELEEKRAAGIVVVAPAMRRLFAEVIPLAARQDFTVLILGETGTGKEVVARKLHASSHRARQAFVRVNCGAIPESLLESALFGHERGAFTGAAQRHLGVFERAHRGTLLLDEVGELPLAAQVRLLRVLESRELERVGGDRTIEVDVRIIAATHRDLDAMVEDGRFRRDLFYRLNVLPLHVPPLRARRMEIAPLARAMLTRLAERADRAPPPLTKRNIARLEAYPWPGNVRELENVLERSFLFWGGRELVLDMPSRIPPRTSAVSFEKAARQTIEEALARSGGRIYGKGGAAELLGLKPTTLASKMARLGVRR